MMSLHVAFRVGTADYVISAEDVLHLESFTEATHVPGAPVFVAGLVQVRGRLVPVIDLRARFGLPAIERSLDNRVIVVKIGARVAGLLVDSAREVVRIDPQSYEPPPELVGSQAAGFVKAITTVAKRLMLVVDVPRVIGEEMPHA
ncbi:MAG: purine-binding chemotaxis protein CheW [Kofleriaceae bacterium]|nr:purine-binding chemotaxis protein CheW [Kofleriaceae bacterium]